MLSSSHFRRFLLPAFAFNAVVIGGGYATGRELVTFFISSGPRAGLVAMLLSTVIWSIVCTLTFLFAFQTRSFDYRAFFWHLLGPAWPAFEIVYILTLVSVIAVYAAAAGTVCSEILGWPSHRGALFLMACSVGVVAYGSEAVERLFKYVTFVLYATFILAAVFAFSSFGDRTLTALSLNERGTSWFTGGLTYAGYNIIGAVLILPVVRRFQSRRDAIVAGLLAGPVTIAPALLFFLCLLAFYPTVMGETLPSDYLLQRLGSPALGLLFEFMIFTALLASATGAIHAFNERIANSYRPARGRELGRFHRILIACSVLSVSVFLAARIGVVARITSGYGWRAAAVVGLYVLPLVTLGSWRILRPYGQHRPPRAANPSVAANRPGHGS